MRGSEEEVKDMGYDKDTVHVKFNFKEWVALKGTFNSKFAGMPTLAKIHLCLGIRTSSDPFVVADD